MVLTKKIGLILIALLAKVAVYGQIASLYAGLSGIVAKKSEVDVELLTQIIVDKQQEVKKEFARRTLLNQINKGSYAFSSFANQSFDILFNTTNKTVASRKLIESSANLALSYGFTEFYLQASRRLLKNKDLSDVFVAADSTLVSLSEKQRWLLYLSAINDKTDEVLWDNRKVTGIDPNKVMKQYLDLMNSNEYSIITPLNQKTIESLSVDSLIMMVNDSVSYINLLTKHPQLLSVVYNQYNNA